MAHFCITTHNTPQSMSMSMSISTCYNKVIAIAIAIEGSIFWSGVT